MNVDALRTLIADHLAVDVSTVHDNASFAADLGADSLDVNELAMRFEEALNITSTIMKRNRAKLSVTRSISLNGRWSSWLRSSISLYATAAISAIRM